MMSSFIPLVGELCISVPNNISSKHHRCLNKRKIRVTQLGFSRCLFESVKTDFTEAWNASLVRSTHLGHVLKTSGTYSIFSQMGKDDSMQGLKPTQMLKECKQKTCSESNCEQTCQFLNRSSRKALQSSSQSIFSPHRKHIEPVTFRRARLNASQQLQLCTFTEIQGLKEISTSWVLQNRQTHISTAECNKMKWRFCVNNAMRRCVMRIECARQHTQ